MILNIRNLYQTSWEGFYLISFFSFNSLINLMKRYIYNDSCNEIRAWNRRIIYEFKMMKIDTQFLCTIDSLEIITTTSIWKDKNIEAWTYYVNNICFHDSFIQKQVTQEK